MMPKPNITIGAERFLNQDKYRMTLIEVSVSNADSYRTVCSRIACVAFSDVQSGKYLKAIKAVKSLQITAFPRAMKLRWYNSPMMKSEVLKPLHFAEIQRSKKQLKYGRKE